MHHFGLICPPGTSHVTALTGIARELCRRGHRATVFNILVSRTSLKEKAWGSAPRVSSTILKAHFRDLQMNLVRSMGWRPCASA